MEVEPASERSTQRLGVYIDALYQLKPTPDGERLASDPVDRPFLLFAAEVATRFSRLVLFGRTVPSERPTNFLELPGNPSLAALPLYENLRDFRAVGRAVGRTVSGFWHGVDDVDVVWVFGPHPFAFVLAAVAALRRKRVVLGVRQDSLRYFRRRLHGGRTAPVLGLVWLMDRGFKLLARHFPTTAVGTELASHYGGPSRSVLSMTVSLVRSRDVVSAAHERDWSSSVELLTVGRIEQEKNPLLLVRALAELNRRDTGRFRLLWLGHGGLEQAVQDEAKTLGIEDLIDLRGHIAFGPELLHLYRQAHAFVHVSLTEGVPQVLLEALASGIPVVATDVGGVSAALRGGEAGLLVPPEDLGAVVAAVERLAADARLRERLVAAGLELAREQSLEAEAGRVADFIQRT